MASPRCRVRSREVHYHVLHTPAASRRRVGGKRHRGNALATAAGFVAIVITMDFLVVPC